MNFQIIFFSVKLFLNHKILGKPSFACRDEAPKRLDAKNIQLKQNKNDIKSFKNFKIQKVLRSSKMFLNVLKRSKTF